MAHPSGPEPTRIRSSIRQTAHSDRTGRLGSFCHSVHPIAERWGRPVSSRRCIRTCSRCRSGTGCHRTIRRARVGLSMNRGERDERSGVTGDAYGAACALAERSAGGWFPARCRPRHSPCTRYCSDRRCPRRCWDHISRRSTAPERPALAGWPSNQTNEKTGPPRSVHICSRSYGSTLRTAVESGLDGLTVLRRCTDSLACTSCRWVS